MFNSNSSTLTNASSDGSCFIQSPMPEEYRTYRFTVDVCLVGLLCIFGFVGNFLCIMVLNRDKENSKDKNTTNWLLQTLAMSDTIYLIACVFFQCIKGK